MSKYGAKTRSHEEKGDKGKSTEASSTKYVTAIILSTH